MNTLGPCSELRPPLLPETSKVPTTDSVGAAGRVVAEDRGMQKCLCLRSQKGRPQILPSACARCRGAALVAELGNGPSTDALVHLRPLPVPAGRKADGARGGVQQRDLG